MRLWICAVLSAAGGLLLASTVVLYELEALEAAKPNCAAPAVPALDSPFGVWLCMMPNNQ